MGGPRRHGISHGISRGFEDRLQRCDVRDRSGITGLVTDTGVIPMTRELISSTESLTLSPSSVQALRAEDSTWISYRGKELFWLPAACRNGIFLIAVPRATQQQTASKIEENPGNSFGDLDPA